MNKTLSDGTTTGCAHPPQLSPYPAPLADVALAVACLAAFCLTPLLSAVLHQILHLFSPKNVYIFKPS